MSNKKTTSTPKEAPLVICVDDEPQVLEALERLLRSEFRVLTTTSAEDGLNLIHKNKDAAILLTDYQMPKMTGVELLKQARKIAPHTVRAIISGQIHLNEISEAINSAEIHRLFLKPWDNEYLRIQMHEAALYHNTLIEKNHLEILSITDPVTQLTNHRYFQERLLKDFEQATLSSLPLSLVMIDVDHFKSFNDHYGHPEGDRLLAEVSSRLKKLCPEKGSVSRYGGEEFGLILPGFDLKSASDLAEKVRKTIEEMPFTGPHGRPAFVTISLGIASNPHLYKKASELVTAADNALYQAKRQGRNQFAVADL